MTILTRKAPCTRVMPRNRAVLLLIAGALAAPALPLAPAQAEPAAARGSGGVGWVELAAPGALAISAPAGTSYHPRRGADSLVGAFRGPGFELNLDYGVYSDPLLDEGRYPSAHRSEISIDGRPGQLVTLGAPLDGGRYFIGLHVPRVTASPLGPVRLTMTGRVEREEDLALVRRMLQTIRFVARQ
jgi:hypothetical protein